MTLPEEVKQKIEERYKINPECSERLMPLHQLTVAVERDAATFGYQLSQQEIKLLEEGEILWSNKTDQLKDELLEKEKTIDAHIKMHQRIDLKNQELQQEIERLKDLLKRVVLRERSEVYPTKENHERVWQQFKTENNL